MDKREKVAYAELIIKAYDETIKNVEHGHCDDLIVQAFDMLYDLFIKEKRPRHSYGIGTGVANITALYKKCDTE